MSQLTMNKIPRLDDLSPPTTTSCYHQAKQWPILLDGLSHSFTTDSSSFLKAFQSDTPSNQQLILGQLLRCLRCDDDHKPAYAMLLAMATHPNSALLNERLLPKSVLRPALFERLVRGIKTDYAVWGAIAERETCEDLLEACRLGFKEEGAMHEFVRGVSEVYGKIKFVMCCERALEGFLIGEPERAAGELRLIRMAMGEDQEEYTRWFQGLLTKPTTSPVVFRNIVAALSALLETDPAWCTRVHRKAVNACAQAKHMSCRASYSNAARAKILAEEPPDNAEKDACEAFEAFYKTNEIPLQLRVIKMMRLSYLQTSVWPAMVLFASNITSGEDKSRAQTLIGILQTCWGLDAGAPFAQQSSLQQQQQQSSSLQQQQQSFSQSQSNDAAALDETCAVIARQLIDGLGEQVLNAPQPDFMNYLAKMETDIYTFCAFTMDEHPPLTLAALTLFRSAVLGKPNESRCIDVLRVFIQAGGTVVGDPIIKRVADGFLYSRQQAINREAKIFHVLVGLAQLKDGTVNDGPLTVFFEHLALKSAETGDLDHACKTLLTYARFHKRTGVQPPKVPAIKWLRERVDCVCLDLFQGPRADLDEFDATTIGMSGVFFNNPGQFFKAELLACTNRTWGPRAVNFIVRVVRERYDPAQALRAALDAVLKQFLQIQASACGDVLYAMVSLNAMFPQVLSVAWFVQGWKARAGEVTEQDRVKLAAFALEIALLLFPRLANAVTTGEFPMLVSSQMLIELGLSRTALPEHAADLVDAMFMEELS